MENTIQDKIQKGNLELKLNQAKQKAKEIGSAALKIGGVAAVSLGLLYGASKLLEKSPEELLEGVPRLGSNAQIEYVVESGDGYSTIAQHFYDGTTSEIQEAYGGNTAYIDDKIVYNISSDSFDIYRNGKLLEPVSNIEQSPSQPTSELEQTVSNSIEHPKAQTIGEDITSYTVPQDSGYGAWRISRELGVDQEDVLRLLEGTPVMGNDVYIKIADDYLALERGNVRVQTELGLHDY